MFLNPVLLFGLVALAVPPLVHLLSRRRFDVVDWGAMQFLQISEKVRKKIFMEQFLLMLLRMGLIALIVLALAGPMLTLPGCVTVGSRPNRDIVIILDGSFSMEYQGEGGTAQDAAKAWGLAFLDELRPGDSVAILQAKQQPQPLLDSLTADLKQARAIFENLPKPRGGVNFAAALHQATQILKRGGKHRDIIVLTDGQKHGWADSKSLERLELFAGANSSDELPRIWVVNVTPDRAVNAPNWSLSPIQSSRAITSLGREVKFKAELQQQTGPQQGAASPKRPLVRMEVDGRPAGEQRPLGGGEKGRLPLTFTQRFTTPGSHLISWIIGEDAMSGDNRQDYALEVMPTLPILIVDGDTRGSRFRGSDFLRDALAPANDTNPAFLVRVVTATDFLGEMLTKPLTREASSIPRVLVLSNMTSIRPEAGKAIETFLQQGGGVFVTLGQRCEGTHYNEEHFRGGQGWLPARLLEPIGNEVDLKNAATLLPQSFESPALELFKQGEPGGLVSAYFPRHWKLETKVDAGGIPVALLNNRQPWLVDKTVGKGHVLLCAVPFDNSWRTNLTDLGDYVRLSHELMYYLASARAGEVNLEAKQPILYRPSDGEQPGPVTIQPPDGPSVRFTPKEWPFVYDDTRETGVYKLTTDTGKVQYYVVQSDAGESDLKTVSEAEQVALTRLLPRLQFITDRQVMREEWHESSREQELWWLFLIAVMIFLAVELWMTQRIAGASPSP